MKKAVVFISDRFGNDRNREIAVKQELLSLGKALVLDKITEGGAKNLFHSARFSGDRIVLDGYETATEVRGVRPAMWIKFDK